MRVCQLREAVARFARHVRLADVNSNVPVSNGCRIEVVNLVTQAEQGATKTDMQPGNALEAPGSSCTTQTAFPALPLGGRRGWFRWKSQRPASTVPAASGSVAASSLGCALVAFVGSCCEARFCCNLLSAQDHEAACLRFLPMCKDAPSVSVPAGTVPWVCNGPYDLHEPMGCTACHQAAQGAAQILPSPTPRPKPLLVADVAGLPFTRHGVPRIFPTTGGYTCPQLATTLNPQGRVGKSNLLVGAWLQRFHAGATRSLARAAASLHPQDSL